MAITANIVAPAPAGPGPCALLARVFAGRAAMLTWFLAFALATRISIFGDTNFFHDELFYFQVGQRMHDGLLPYADLWDRKGPGLFATAWFVAGISKSIIAWQAAAWLSAALTALVVAIIARRSAGSLGAVLAGTLYLAILPFFGGAAAQSPVFYNLWIALAALGTLDALPALRQGRVPVPLMGAMAAAGFAITFKQSATCEAVFLGCFAVWQLARSGIAASRLGRHALMLALAGAAPMLVFAAFYAAIGHFAEFWHAMVTSNLTKAYIAGNEALTRATGLTLMFSPVLLLAAFGIACTAREGALPRSFVAGWLVAGIAGVAIVPNFFDHYMLPLAVPACVAAARALEWRVLGPALGGVAAFLMLSSGPSFDFADRRESREEMATLAARIGENAPGGRVFVFEGPVYLYALLRRYPPTPVFYPYHLFYRAEQDAAYFDVSDEVRKVLAWRPEVVVIAHGEPSHDENPETARIVRGYLRAHCRLLFTHRVRELYGPREVDVWGACAHP